MKFDLKKLETSSIVCCKMHLDNIEPFVTDGRMDRTAVNNSAVYRSALKTEVLGADRQAYFLKFAAL